MKTLKLDDKDLFKVATTLTVEPVMFDRQDLVQIALFSDPQLEGEGIFLSQNNVIKLYKWLKQYLGE